MTKKARVYCPPTTEQQRVLLFKSWEESGNVSAACKKARVVRQTFYTWRPHFEQEGYGGLKTPRSHARKEPGRVSSEIEKQVIALRQANAKWGKQRIADELAKSNGWVPLVSHTTVKRILKDAGLWPVAEEPAKKGVLSP
jgi:transposase